MKQFLVILANVSALVAAALLLPGCPPVCAAGSQVGCDCPSGRVGAQTCAANGSGYNACVCAGDDAGADVDAGQVQDVVQMPETGRDAGPSLPNPGAPCAVAADCPANGVCIPAAAGWRDGYCTYPCSVRGPSVACGPQGTCGSNSFLAGLGSVLGGPTTCARACAHDSDCRVGYFCGQDITSQYYCQPDCTMAPGLLCGEGLCGGSTVLDPRLCSNDCNLGCSPASDCQVSGGGCACNSYTDCGPGRACYMSIHQCGCADDSVCPNTMHCDLASGLCR